MSLATELAVQHNIMQTRGLHRMTRMLWSNVMLRKEPPGKPKQKSPWYMMADRDSALSLGVSVSSSSCLHSDVYSAT